jgi:hypothetical protein
MINKTILNENMTIEHFEGVKRHQANISQEGIVDPNGSQDPLRFIGIHQDPRTLTKKETIRLQIFN